MFLTNTYNKAYIVFLNYAEAHGVQDVKKQLILTL